MLLNGARLTDFAALRDLPARSIERIELLSGIEGAVYHGTNAGAGVIVIHTRSGPRRDH